MLPRFTLQLIAPLSSAFRLRAISCKSKQLKTSADQHRGLIADQTGFAAAVFQTPLGGTMHEEVENLYQAEALFENLIESAFLAGLISGKTESLIYEWLRWNGARVH